MLNAPAAHTVIAAATTSTGATAAVLAPGATRTYQGTALATSGTGNAVIAIQGSMAGSSYWDTIGTITLTSASTAGASDGFSSNDRYTYVRLNVTTLSSNVSVGAVLGY